MVSGAAEDHTAVAGETASEADGAAWEEEEDLAVEWSSPYPLIEVVQILSLARTSERADASCCSVQTAIYWRRRRTRMPTRLEMGGFNPPRC